MSKREDRKDEVLNPSEVAAYYLEQYKGDVVGATNAMTEEVLSNLKLYRIIMDPMVRMACYSYMTGICRKERKKIWDPVQPSAASEAHAVGHLGGGMESAYMLFRLPGGKYLKDANKDEVHDGAEFYLQQGQDMVIKGRWLRLIERKMPDNRKHVGGILDEKILAKLRTEAEKQ